MSKNNSFRWRNNPAVIAKYWKADALPKNAEVTLKPNEACVVVENGRIVGISTQTKIEQKEQDRKNNFKFKISFSIKYLIEI